MTLAQPASSADTRFNPTKPLVSMVIPCLNEANTLPSVMSGFSKSFLESPSNYHAEIIVVDNGSSDGSSDLAESLGAQVVHCEEKGYGAALQAGIEAASGEFVIFTDGDATYDATEAPTLLRALEDGADLVIGSRLCGTIEKGAMPLLHRFLGTPVLTALINVLFSGCSRRISDCNSGFRALRKSRYKLWGTKSSGMEFASELIIKAMKSGAHIAEVPVTLRPSPVKRTPHLQTWRDGMRHLLQILVESPSAFFYCSIFPIALGMLILGVGVSIGIRPIFGMNLFGLHSMLAALLSVVLGVNLWGIGLLLSVKVKKPMRLYAWVLDLREDKLLWGLLVAAIMIGLFAIKVLSRWVSFDFAFLDQERVLICVATLIVALFSSGTHIIAAHLLKRS